jgi:hypothetical protein
VKFEFPGNSDFRHHAWDSLVFIPNAVRRQNSCVKLAEPLRLRCFSDSMRQIELNTHIGRIERIKIVYRTEHTH